MKCRICKTETEHTININAKNVPVCVECVIQAAEWVVTLVKKGTKKK